MQSIKVLFIGNSHTFYNDMPTIFQQLCSAAGIDAQVSMQAHPGVPLGWHLNQRFELRYALVHGGYDYVVFQQAAHPCPAKEETLRDGKAMVELIRQSGAVPIATITWAERRFPQNQAKMYGIFDALAEQTKVLCSPVGQVFQRVAAELPDVDLYWYDGEHCSPYGSYAVAATAFARITGKSPVGLPAESLCSILTPEEPAAQIRAKFEAAQAKADAGDELMELYRQYGQLIYDPHQLTVALDEEKCGRLQQIIAEELQRYDRTHAGAV